MTGVYTGRPFSLVIAVAERAGNRNDALVVVIGQGDEHVNASRGRRGMLSSKSRSRNR